MSRYTLIGMAALCLAGVSLLQADDVYVKGKEKPIVGKVTKESVKEIMVGVKDTIAAEDIVDIVYDLTPVTANIQYRQAVKAEKDSLDPAQEPKRKGNLATAITILEKVLPDVVDKNAKRHLEYKVAMLRVRQVQEDGEPVDKAIAKLKDFGKKNPNCWQINMVLQTLGRLQVDAGDYAGAEDAYSKLAKTEGISDDVKQDAKLLAIQAKIQGGNHVEARDELVELQKELKPGSRFQARARVAEAECLVAEAKKFKDKEGDGPKEKEKNQAARGKLFTQAVDLVRGVIKESNDRYVKAVGHNTLGYCYLEQDQPKDAMWEFLWVDVVYNQDRVQHAKALYHLWDIFTKDGDAPRAQECREALLAPQFNGLEYQKLVQKAEK